MKRKKHKPLLIGVALLVTGLLLFFGCRRSRDYRHIIYLYEDGNKEQTQELIGLPGHKNNNTRYPHFWDEYNKYGYGLE